MTEENAIRASNVKLQIPSSGIADKVDNAAISLGYRLATAYPEGFTQQQYTSFVLDGVRQSNAFGPIGTARPNSVPYYHSGGGGGGGSW